jgi:hypothetical protein
VVPLLLAGREGTKTIRERFGLGQFVVHERFLRGGDGRIDDAEVRDHHVTTGVVAIGEEPNPDVALDVLIGLIRVPFLRERDEFVGVMGTEDDHLGEVSIHGRSACTAPGAIGNETG